MLVRSRLTRRREATQTKTGSTRQEEGDDYYKIHTRYLTKLVLHISLYSSSTLYHFNTASLPPSNLSNSFFHPSVCPHFSTNLLNSSFCSLWGLSSPPFPPIPRSRSTCSGIGANTSPNMASKGGFFSFSAFENSLRIEAFKEDLLESSREVDHKGVGRDSR